MKNFFLSDLPTLFSQSPAGALLLCAVILLVATLLLGAIYFSIFPKRKDLYHRLILFAVCLMFLGGAVLGCYLAIGAFIDSREAAATGAWPSVQGLVRGFRVEKVAQLGSKSGVYKVQLTYSYSVNGAAYTSNRAGAGDHLAAYLPEEYSSGGAADAMGRKLVNSPIQVYYDPARPEKAVLLAGVVNYSTLLKLLAMAAVLLSSFLVVSRAFFSPKAQASPPPPDQGLIRG